MDNGKPERLRALGDRGLSMERRYSRARKILCEALRARFGYVHESVSGERIHAPAPAGE